LHPCERLARCLARLLACRAATAPSRACPWGGEFVDEHERRVSPASVEDQHCEPPRLLVIPPGRLRPPDSQTRFRARAAAPRSVRRTPTVGRRRSSALSSRRDGSSSARGPPRSEVGGAAGTEPAPLRHRARPRAHRGIRLARRQRRALRLRSEVPLGSLALRMGISYVMCSAWRAAEVSGVARGRLDTDLQPAPGNAAPVRGTLCIHDANRSGAHAVQTCRHAGDPRSARQGGLRGSL
jgi:hypothetical protein